jgi:hypothetical protein
MSLKVEFKKLDATIGPPIMPVLQGRHNFVYQLLELKDITASIINQTVI